MTESNHDALVLAHILDEVGIGVVAADAEGTITHWNADDVRLLGYQAGEAVGQHSVEFGTAAFDHRGAELILTTALSGQTWSGEYPLCHRNGHRLLAYLNVAPLRAADGSVGGVLCLFYEADRHRADEALASLFDRLFTDAPIGIAILDTEYRFLRLNPTAQRLTGLPEAAVLGRDLKTVVPHGGDLLTGQLEKVLRSGEPVTDLELWAADPDDESASRCWLTSFYRLQGEEEQEPVGVAMLITDATGERRSVRAHHRLATRLALLRDAAQLISLPNRPTERLAGLLAVTLPDYAARAELHAVTPSGQHLLVADAEPGAIRLGELGAPWPAAPENHPSRWPAAVEVPQQLGRVLTVPVQLFGEPYGVLTLTRSQDRGPFGGDDVVTAESLAGYVAVALADYLTDNG